MTENYQCFHKNNIKTLFDDEATKERIMDEIRNQLYKTNSSEWNLIIYFCGHGDYRTRSKKGYWIPHDAKYEKLNTYISFEEIQKLMSNSSIFHILLIADSCYAGGIFSYYRTEHFTQKCYTIKSRWALTSGRKELVCDGTNVNPSPFSEILVHILNLNAKTSKDLNVRRLCLDLTEDFERKFNEKEQMPEAMPLEINGYNHNGGQFVFIPKITSNIPLEIDGKPLNAEKNIAENEILSESKPEEGMPMFDSSTDTQSIIQKPNLDSQNPDTNLGVLSKEEKDEGTEHRKKIRAIIVFMSLFLLIIIMTAFSILMQKRTEPTLPNSTVPTGAATASVIITTDLSQPLIDYKTSTSPVKVDDEHMKALRDDFKTQKTRINTQPQSDTSKNTNIVFAGSFQNKENALNILSQLKKIGYLNSEIVMKQDLPYLTVVTGFNIHQSKAKQEVKSLQKKGIEAYKSEREMDKIYRKKK